MSCSATLSFGLAHFASSEFELMAEELLMSDSVVKASGGTFGSLLFKSHWLSFHSSAFSFLFLVGCSDYFCVILIKITSATT